MAAYVCSDCICIGLRGNVSPFLGSTEHRWTWWSSCHTHPLCAEPADRREPDHCS